MREPQDIWTAPDMESKTLWVFADKLEGDIVCQFKGTELRESKKGDKYPVLVFYNADYEEILVSGYKANVKDAVAKQGKDMHQWIDKSFRISIKNARPHVVCLEEDVE